jgi:hypothetical protein
MILYCAMLFQIVNYWDAQKVEWHSPYFKNSEILRDSDDLTLVAPEYLFNTITWGASLKDCVYEPASNQLERLSYFVDFDGDGKVCR